MVVDLLWSYRGPTVDLLWIYLTSAPHPFEYETFGFGWMVRRDAHFL